MKKRWDADKMITFVENIMFTNHECIFGRPYTGNQEKRAD